MRRNRILLVQYESIFSFPAGIFSKLVTRSHLMGDDILPIVGNGLLSRLHVAAGILSDSLIVSAAASKSKFPTSLREKIVTLPTGAWTAPDDQNRWNTSPLTAVFVGSPSYMPNRIAARHILSAARRLPKDLRLRIMIIGGFQTNKTSPEAHLHDLGKVTEAELRSVYSRSHVGLLPFFGTVPEGPKVKALEYFSAGLLVISSAEGVSGIGGLIPWVHYIPADSTAELVDRLIQCTPDEGTMKRIAKSGKQHVLRNYSWERVSRAYINHVRRVENKSLHGNKQ